MSGTSMVALLCAAALAPVLGAEAGVGSVLVAGLDRLRSKQRSARQCGE
jgi:hypothetical protein